jgi:hypothetical protein
MRVNCILLTVWWHFCAFGKLDNYPRRAPRENYIFQALRVFFTTGNNGLVALSGYFGVTSRGLNIRRLIVLYLIVVFYCYALVLFVNVFHWKEWYRRTKVWARYPLHCRV